MKQEQKEAGFTLVELLVVIAVIGVLVGLLLPAVQAAREAARRMECSNRTRQIGLAITNYHSAFKQLPRAWWLETPPTHAFNGSVWGIAILPFLEKQSLYEKFDHSRLPVNEFSVSNVRLAQTLVPDYLCPSSPGDPDSRRYDFNAGPAGLPLTASRLAPSDFTPTTGVSGVYAHHAFDPFPSDGREGAMQVVGMFGGSNDGTYAGIRDGLSNTFLIGERTGGAEIYSAGRIDPVATANLIGLDGGGWGDLLGGEHWLQGSLHSGLSWPPTGGPCAINCTNARGYGFHSFHNGGSYFLFADNAVVFFTPSVDATVFASHITRGNDEVIEYSH